MRRIEVVCHDNQGPSTEFVFKKFKVPFHSEQVFSEEQNNIDLIVIGSHGRSGFKNLVLGSVASGIVSKSHCPVLLV